MPMDPLNGVSTDGGKNMRETCARVLAAALLTGAIATVVGMSAVFGTPGQASRPLAAPPSALQRTVRLSVQPLPSRRLPRVTRVTAPRLEAWTRPQVVTRSLVVVRPARHHVRPAPSRQLAASKPAPAPPPAAVVPAAPAQVAAPTPAVAPPATDEGDDPEHAHGDHS